MTKRDFCPRGTLIRAETKLPISTLKFLPLMNETIVKCFSSDFGCAPKNLFSDFSNKSFPRRLTHYRSNYLHN